MSFLDYLIEGADDQMLNGWRQEMAAGADTAGTEEEAASFRRPLTAIEAEIERRAEMSGGAS